MLKECIEINRFDAFFSLIRYCQATNGFINNGPFLSLRQIEPLQSISVDNESNSVYVPQDSTNNEGKQNG